jgi:hypothetical protein
MITIIPVQHRTLPEEGYDAASYLVGYEGSGHAYALHLHSLKFYVGMKWDMRRIVSII